MNPMQQWIEQHGPLSDQQNSVRKQIRNFCCGLTHDELLIEEKIRKAEDPFRSACIRELIFEEYPQ